MDEKEKIEYWLELAEEDLITAEIVLKSKRFLHFGFLSHLSIEKLLKSYYWKSKMEEPPYTHSLLVLSSKSGLDNILDERFKQLLFKLMPLNIEGRYPTSKQEINKTLSHDYCEELYSDVKDFLLWIKTLLTK